VPTYTGTSASESLTGSTSADTLFGLAGDDTLAGLAGNDRIEGGDGFDLSNYSASTTAVVVNLLTGSATGGHGTDTLLGIEGAIGGSGADNLTGDANANAFFGGAGNDSIFGGDGDDTIMGGTGNDNLQGGVGLDVITYASSSSGVVVNLSTGAVTGGDGTDTISGFENVIGSASNDTITGDANDNVVAGGAGADSLTGGAGVDVLDYSTSTAAVVIDLTVTTQSGGHAEGDVVAGFEGIIGSAYDDTLTGDANNNTFIGGAGADSIIGGDGNDTADYSRSSAGVAVNLATLVFSGGDAAGDNLAGIEYIIGSAFDDTITGALAANLLVGGAGADALSGGLGADTMIGGTGDDTFTVDGSTDVVTEAANEGTDLVRSSVDWVLGANFENLTLIGDGDITGDGNDLANLINGNSGTGIFVAKGMNLLRGFGGNDTINGLGGTDTIDGGTGADRMSGGKDSDTYYVDDVGDVVIEKSGEGVDRVYSSVSRTLEAFVEHLYLTGTDSLSGTGNVANNSIQGNDGNNALYGLAGNDTLNGGLGDDTLDGGAGKDNMSGGAGNDTYYVSQIDDSITELGGNGTDAVIAGFSYDLSVAMAGSIENLTLTGTGNFNGIGNGTANTITGNVGANSLTGGSGNDTLYGGDGNDTLEGGTDTDSLVGGKGDDVYIVRDLDVIVEAAAQGTDVVQASVSFTLAANLESLVLLGTSGLSGTGNTAANRLTGNSGNNLLSGLEGADTLDGGAGNDSLNGGAGADSMIGGLGNDTFVVDHGSDVIVELAGEGTDLVQASVAYTLGGELENLTLTGAGAIAGTGSAIANIITGNTAANRLSGMDGNDTIYGGDGNDTLDGGAGTDSLIGGLGDDRFILDSALDRVSESSGGGTDTVEIGFSYSLATYFENLVLTGTAAINGEGNSSANAITGNSAANLLEGGSGNDTLTGGNGNDTLDGGNDSDSMSGGLGDDQYVVASVGDIVVEAASAGSDRVLSSISYTLTANVETLDLQGSSGLSGTGNTGANRINGNSGSNLLSGLGGNDTLYGAGGNDTLVGGTGADRFVFNASSSGTDTISDFNQIDGGASEGDLLEFQGLLTGTFAWLGTGSYTGTGNTEARLVGDTVTIDTDGNGSTNITIRIMGLDSATDLTASDFLFT